MSVVFSCTNGGRDVLAIDSGLTPAGFAKSRIPHTLTDRGTIIDPSGAVTVWPVEENFSRSLSGRETICVAGPAFPGRTLLELVEGDPETAWKQLCQAISLVKRALAAGTLPESSIAGIAGAGAEAVLVSDSGQVLLLPAELFIRCLGGHGIETETAHRLDWIHPDYRSLKPARAFAFLAGTLAYRIVAGKAPFAREQSPDGSIQADDREIRMREELFESAALAVWPLRQAAAECIDTLLTASLATSTDTLMAFGPEYGALLDPARAGMPEPAERAELRAADARRRTARLHRKDLRHKYRTALFISLGVLAFAVFMIVTVITDRRGKPTTIGMEPEQIVAGFYRAIGTLDQIIPQAYTAHGVDTGYSDFVSNLYVTSNIRETYERNGGILPPAELFLLGNTSGRSVYGITALDIVPHGTAEGERAFSVSFYLWLPYSMNADDSAESGTVMDATEPI